MNKIYLDSAATTRPYDEVIEKMADIMKNQYGNPSSNHNMGIEADKLINQAREIIAYQLNTSSQNIYFTSGGTEANNWAIHGSIDANLKSANHVITSEIEHKSVINSINKYNNKNIEIDYIPVDNKGFLKLDVLADLVTKNTLLVSLIYVNNETGAIQNIQEACNIIKRKNSNCIIHCDAVQAFGKIKLDLSNSFIDLLSISSHKIHGPKGVGSLYIRQGVRINPIFFGGEQERKMRSGTHNVAGICGMGIATDIKYNKCNKKTAYIQDIKQYSINALQNEFKNDFTVNSPENSVPYILNFSLLNTKAEIVLNHLNHKNIFVSAGSACASKKDSYSHVLKAMNLSKRSIEGAIRISFCEHNTKEDINILINELKYIVNLLKM